MQFYSQLFSVHAGSYKENNAITTAFHHPAMQLQVVISIFSKYIKSPIDFMFNSQVVKIQ